MRVFSSNYALYGDMSGRANEIYRSFSPRVEIYSIDGSFLDLSDMDTCRRVELGRDLRSTLLAWTGLPSSPTHIAKKNPRLGGVCDLTDEAVRLRWMNVVALDEVWGMDGLRRNG